MKRHVVAVRNFFSFLFYGMLCYVVVVGIFAAVFAFITGRI